MATLDARMPDDGPAVFYEAGFRQMLEDHMVYLREHPSTDTMDISPHVANKHHGDLVGVLLHYEIPLHLHWPMMRLNNYTSPMQYSANDLTLMYPAQTVISMLLSRYRANQKISTSA